MGEKNSLQECADACRSNEKCRQYGTFIYGHSDKAKRCYSEGVTNCPIWESDQYNFYKLNDGDKENWCKKGIKKCQEAGAKIDICSITKDYKECTFNSSSFGNRNRFVYIYAEPYASGTTGSDKLIKIREVRVFAKTTATLPNEGDLLTETRDMKMLPDAIVDLGESAVMKEIQVGGEEGTARKDWITSFRLKYSNDGFTWIDSKQTLELFPGKSYTCATYTKNFCHLQNRDHNENRGCYQKLSIKRS